MRHGTQQVHEHVEGHKLPLFDIRQQGLTDHFQYMQLQKQDTLQSASRLELEGLVGQTANQMSKSELRLHVQTHIALCHFAVWHDHSTVCGCGFIMVTCKEVYDRLVHYTDAEYKALVGLSVDVQALVERPYVHLLAAGSSSASDHIAFTVDRLEWVKALDSTLQAPYSTEVADLLRFFNGDKMAQWTKGVPTWRELQVWFLRCTQ